jgi:hypothetical protein
MIRFFAGICLFLTANSSGLLYAISTSTAIRTVAVTGIQNQNSSVIGTIVDFEFGGQLGPPLNNVGQVAFNATFRDDVGHLHPGIWLGTPDKLNLVAGIGEAPNLPGSRFNWFFRPVLNDNGDVAFRGWMEPGFGGVTGDDFRGVWATTNGVLRTVARQGSQVPNAPTELTFGEFFSDPVLNKQGDLALGLERLEGPYRTYGGNGLFVENSGDGRLLARGSIIQGENAQFKSVGTYLMLSDGRRVVSRFFLNTSEDRDAGIWFADLPDGTVMQLFQEEATVPGEPPGSRFNYFGTSQTINTAGQAAFVIGYFGTESAVLSNESGQYRVILRSGQPAVGFPHFEFNSFDFVDINSSGQIVFYSRLNLRNVCCSHEGIWVYDHGALRLIVGTDQLAPGTSSQFRLGGAGYDGVHVINADGRVAFMSQLNSTVTTDGGIWAEDAAGELQLIVRTGDQIDVNPGPKVDLRTITDLRFGGPKSTGYGRSGFNDLGQVAFWAHFADGSQGIFISNLVAIPEPSTNVLVWAVSFCVARFRRRVTTRYSDQEPIVLNASKTFA